MNISERLLSLIRRKPQEPRLQTSNMEQTTATPAVNPLGVGRAQGDGRQESGWSTREESAMQRGLAEQNKYGVLLKTRIDGNGRVMHTYKNNRGEIIDVWDDGFDHTDWD